MEEAKQRLAEKITKKRVTEALFTIDTWEKAREDWRKLKHVVRHDQEIDRKTYRLLRGCKKGKLCRLEICPKCQRRLRIDLTAELLRLTKDWPDCTVSGVSADGTKVV